MRTVQLVRVIALASMLSACSTTVVKVMEADSCPVPAEQLTTRCALTQSLREGATYDDLVRLAVTDAANLRSCSEQAAFLRSAIEACNVSIEKHNAKIREINARVGEGK